MSAEVAINAILQADSATHTAASGGIYVDIAKQSAVPSFIVYRLTDITPEPTKDGASDFDMYEMELASISKTALLADTLANLVKTALDDYTGTIAGVVVNRITFKGKRGTYDQQAELFIREQDYTVIIKT